MQKNGEKMNMEEGARVDAIKVWSKSCVPTSFSVFSSLSFSTFLGHWQNKTIAETLVKKYNPLDNIRQQ